MQTEDMRDLLKVLGRIAKSLETLTEYVATTAVVKRREPPAPGERDLTEQK